MNTPLFTSSVITDPRTTGYIYGHGRQSVKRFCRQIRNKYQHWIRIDYQQAQANCPGYWLISSPNYLAVGEASYWISSMNAMALYKLNTIPPPPPLTREPKNPSTTPGTPTPPPTETRIKLLILVGSPGSGKSTFAKRLVAENSHWIRANQDELGSRQACERVLRTCPPNSSVVIDRCNVKRSDRQHWMDQDWLAQLGATASECACIFFNTGTTEDYIQRIEDRPSHPTLGSGKQSTEVIRGVVNRFLSDLEAPSCQEGFAWVEDVTDTNTDQLLRRLQSNPTLSR